MKQLLRYTKNKYNFYIFLFFYNLFSIATAQNIKFRDIKVYSNFDSLINLSKQQRGFDKLKTLLSIEKSYSYWYIEHERWSPNTLDIIVRKEFNQSIGHLYVFKAQYAFQVERNKELAIEFATRSFEEYTKQNDTTGKIYALVMMGSMSFARDLNSAEHYPPFLLDAYKLSLQSNKVEDKLWGNYARIRNYGDSLKIRNKEICAIAEKSIEMIDKNPYFDCLKLIFLNTLSLAHGAKNDYTASYNFDYLGLLIRKKHNIEAPLPFLGNLGHDCLILKRYDLAKYYFEEALKFIYTHNTKDLEGRAYVFYHYHAALVGLKQYKKASIYADSIYIYSRKFRISQNTKIVNEIAAKYQIKEKEKETLLLQKENKRIEEQNRIYLIFVLIFIFTLAIIIYNSYKLRQSNKKWEIANTKIKLLNQTKDYFYGIIAHDLRQPIVSLQGISNTVKYYISTKDYHTAEKIISTFDDSSRRLQLMLDNLLKWTLEQRDEIIYKPEIISLHSLILDCMEIYEGIIRSKNIDFRLICDEDCELLADRNSLLLIFRNLIGNSLKIMPRDGVIIVNVKREFQYTQIKIIDTGPGIDENKLTIIRQIFKSPENFHPGEDGMGLGMLLVSKFIKHNKGTITVESVQGIGTTFTMILP